MNDQKTSALRPSLSVPKNRERLYSGDKSAKFWKRVRAIPWGQGGEAIYIAGCLLQDVEGRVLQALEAAEEKRGKK